MQLSYGDLPCRQRTQTTKVKELEQYLSQSNLNLATKNFREDSLKTDSMLKMHRKAIPKESRDT